MRYRGERLVEVVQQAFPLLVLLRSSEAGGVILQVAPFDEQQLFALIFEAVVQFVRDAAVHRRDDARGVAEGSLELALHVLFYVQHCRFKDHRVLLIHPSFPYNKRYDQPASIRTLPAGGSASSPTSRPTRTLPLYSACDRIDATSERVVPMRKDEP